MLERLKKSLLEAPIFKRGSYNYFIHPITDGVPEVRPELIREVTANRGALPTWKWTNCGPLRPWEFL